MTHPLFLAQEWFHRWWFTKPNSTQAAETDRLFMFILWVCIFSFVLLMGAMCWFIYKYHRKPGVPTIRSASHNTPLELAWSIGPLLILVPIFFWGFHGYIGKQAAPANAEVIHVVGEKWLWSPTYSNGATPREFRPPITAGANLPDIPVIHVPAHRPVRLMLTSKDVIHAFFIPDFRAKIDVFPNRYTSMWFEPMDPTPFKTDSAGNIVKDSKGNPLYADHHVFCAEYCGDNHSEMSAYIRVVPYDEFIKVKDELSRPPPGATPEELGEFYWGKKFGCRSCHTIDGTKSTGPTWKDLYGRTEHFMDGSTIDLSDDLTFENYVRESVLTPQAKIVQGFGPQMNSYMGQVKQDHLQAIIAFMKSAKVAPTMAAKKGAAGGGAAPGGSPGGATDNKPGAAPPKPEEKPGTAPPAAPKPGG